MLPATGTTDAILHRLCCWKAWVSHPAKPARVLGNINSSSSFSSEGHKKRKKNHHNAKIVFSLRRYLCQSPKTADMGKAHTRHQETWPRKMYRLHYDRQAAVVPSYVTSQNRKPVVPIHAARSSNRCEIRDLMTSINCRLHFHESSDTCELLTGSFSSPFAEIFDHFSLRTFAL